MKSSLCLVDCVRFGRHTGTCYRLFLYITFIHFVSRDSPPFKAASNWLLSADGMFIFMNTSVAYDP